MVHETENAVGANADAVREDFSMVEFREQCRRQLGRRLEDRIKYGFCRVYKPCDASLPEYLGFRIATP
jgi:hypothetical protein